MPLSRPVAAPLSALTLATLALTATIGWAQDAGEPVGDPERGLYVYRQVGYCVSCHGWAGDGKSGTNLQAPVGPSLRETRLDTLGLLEVIGCGRPGTPMPYHDRAAYRDDRCYGMTMDDFSEGAAPVRGRTFSDRDVANVVAYLQAQVIGLGEPTFEECARFYDNPSAAACASFN